MHERAFKRTRLRVGTVHDGHVRIRRALLGADAQDFPSYPRGLLLGVVRGIADDRVPAAQCGPQLFGLATLVVGDDRVGRVEDGLRGTVVLFEHDGLRVGEILLEILDVADVRAAERIDRLVGVADDGVIHAGPARPAEGASGTTCPAASTPASSRISSYWAWFVSWYSSTRI